MKISIESDSQEEFDKKRGDVIKALAGSKLRVSVSKSEESLATDKKEPYFDSQKQILDHWNKRYEEMIKEIKADIDAII